MVFHENDSVMKMCVLNWNGLYKIILFIIDIKCFFGKTIFCCWNLLDVSFFVSCESEEYLVTSLIIVWALTERGSMTWQMKKQMQLGYLKQYFLFTSYLFFKQSCISYYHCTVSRSCATKLRRRWCLVVCLLICHNTWTTQLVTLLISLK